MSSPLTVLFGNLPLQVRQELTRLLHAESDLWVVGAAGANDLSSTARRLRPDLVIVGENQLARLEQLAQHYPVPVLLYSDVPPRGEEVAQAARWGLYEHVNGVPQPTHPLFSGWRRELLRKIRAGRRVLTKVAGPISRRMPAVVGAPISGVVVIGGSTGGSAAVEQLVRQLRPPLTCAVLVAVHLPGHFTDSLVDRLRRATSLPVVSGEAGTLLEAGKIIVAPGGYNMVVRPVTGSPWLAWQTEFTSEVSPSADEPSVDLLMRSAASCFGRKALGVVLSGLGRDGTLGAEAIRLAGGTVAVQNQASAAVFSMPNSVIQAGHANVVLPLDGISEFIRRSLVMWTPTSRLHASSTSEPVRQ
ncbi:hypothetical protein LJY25_01870 [Hymenobacter sp. BT175]|uniref:chemotaxis protein CheB n=1 Tax=Hymenobacter translucens TaxID=2886507 RepID=UPI001D0EE860|nr:chemotaxis protein CheB [Hymenobacter translucens]MCC2545179.1 hypothetical protein [Hymenobacter translucens]